MPVRVIEVKREFIFQKIEIVGILNMREEIDDDKKEKGSTRLKIIIYT